MGSTAKLSRPAAATWPERTACSSAASSTRPPRAVFTRITPRLQAASVCAFTMPRFSGVSGQCSEIASDSRQIVVQVHGADEVRQILRIRIVPEHLHAHRIAHAREALADGAQAHQPDGAPVQLHALVRGLVPVAGVHARIELHDRLGAGEHQRQRLFGDGRGIGARRRRAPRCRALAPRPCRSCRCRCRAWRSRAAKAPRPSRRRRPCRSAR